MKAADALEIVRLLEDNGVEVWLDGGWGVDALLGRQTRPHRDLDIAIEHKDVPRLRRLLETRGYREVSKPDAKDWNFVLGDDRGHEVDVHSYAFDERGEHVYGTGYPPGALGGVGTVDGRPVKCISAEHAVRFRTGYELRESDVQDVLALHRRFDIPLPKELDRWLTGSKKSGSLLGSIGALKPVGRRTAIVAIDGYGGGGKSTLAQRIAAALPNVTVVRTDDFARPKVPGWEWRRIRAQVLDPINRDKPGRYQRYDWNEDRLAEWHDVPVGGVLIVEGVSSMRTELGAYWDLAIWVTCSYERRLERGIARDGEGMRSQWENVWMPQEEEYVAAQKPEQRADRVVSGDDPFPL